MVEKTDFEQPHDLKRHHLQLTLKTSNSSPTNKPTHGAFPRWGVLCIVIFVCAMILPLLLYANRHLVENSMELVLWANTWLTGAMGVAVGLAVSRYSNVRGK